MVELLGRSAPGVEVRGRGERGDTSYPLVVGRGRERERAAEAESREGDLLLTRLYGFEHPRQVRSPLGRRERPGAAADARERAARDEPARFIRQVLGEFGQEAGGLATHAERARKSVHEYEHATSDGPNVRRRDAQVQ